MLFFLYLNQIQSIFLNNSNIYGSIESNWMETPLLAEALCFFQEIDHSAFWDILEIISNIKKIPSNINEILDFSSKFLEKESLLLLNFSLQIRFYSPRIELYRKLSNYSEDSIIKCKNMIITNFDENVQCQSEFFDFEPIFGKSNSSLIFYLNINSKNWIKSFKKLQSIENLSFTVRPYGLSNIPMKLSGYGVELKPFRYSMEFQVKDQSKLIPSSESLSKNIKFFNNINLTVNLTQEYKFIKKDKLPYQLLTFLRQSNDPISTLVELSQNYPLFSNQINHIKYKEEFTRTLNRVAQYSSPGQNSLFINGRLLTGVDLNYFTIYQSLLEEYRSHDILKNLFSLDIDTLISFKKSGSVPKAPQIPIIDARSNLFIYWVNDLEKDPRYSKYPKTLNVFASDSDKFPNIARNVANAIFLLDPSDPDDLSTIATLDSIDEALFPCHVGYIISPNKRSQMSKKIYYAWAHIALNYGMKTAHKMLMKINNMRDFDVNTKIRGPVKANFWDTAFGQFALNRKSPSFKRLPDLFGSSTDETRFLTRIQEHISRLGINSPAIIMNGQFIESEHPEAYIHSLMSEQLEVIRQLMVQKVITDSTEDIHGAILSRPIVAKRFNPLIQRTVKDFSETLDIQTQCTHNQRIFANWIPTINYDFGSSNAVKTQTHWIFVNSQNKNVIREIERFANELADREKTRISIFTEDKLPNKIIQQIIGIKLEFVTVVFNGRIVRFEPEKFSRYDLQLLEQWENTFSTNFATTVTSNLAKSRNLGSSRSHREISDSLLYMTIISSSLAHKGTHRTGLPYKSFKNKATNIFRKFKNETELTVHLMIDPLSIEGQRMCSMLPLLRQFNFGLMINPLYNYAKLDVETINTFYCSVLNSNEFIFNYFNSSTTYSLIPDVPLTWQISRDFAGFDLDNIVADELSEGIHKINYKLDSILVEGCSTTSSGRVVSGLELSLYNNYGGKKIDETRVISKNGYWQLNSNPGEFNIFTNSNNNYHLYIHSFLPNFNFYICSEEILYEYNKTHIDDGKIHIFIVASGFLYERLERIMMLSVIKNTKYSVKFWLFSNFVSPQHKLKLPKFSKKYNFEYEFCSYKWPRWMPQELERQRLFWGYKILFLDVMFPNHLKRVIYIDADDVIRTDMMELMTMNFEGAPYAFTPFCDDKPEMEPYRFWQDGYWRNLLNGKRYHISALFAIDLEIFRRKEVGDMIRKAYSDLAHDKKSLSNLDQDLPNLLQDRAPIFSLPQNWLWCGSWCSDETMKNAKLIDLCNNPKTKIGKLDYAKKTIPEWIPLDKEANEDDFNDEL